MGRATDAVLTGPHRFAADARIVPFLTRFLRYMNAQGPGAFNTGWVATRCCSSICFGSTATLRCTS